MDMSAPWLHWAAFPPTAAMFGAIAPCGSPIMNQDKVPLVVTAVSSSVFVRVAPWGSGGRCPPGQRAADPTWLVGGPGCRAERGSIELAEEVRRTSERDH